MRILLELFCVVALGLLLAGGLSWYSIQNNHGFGALNVGVWTAWPQVGNVNSDPYTIAKVAVDGTVPLGAAEGLAFHARQDETGERLKRECRYRLTGNTPPARLWTLSANDENGSAVTNRESRPSSVFSQNLIRVADGSFDIHAGPIVEAGNWLSVTGEGPYDLVLRLYDTPLTANAGLVEPIMPRIVPLGCP